MRNEISPPDAAGPALNRDLSKWYLHYFDKYVWNLALSLFLAPCVLIVLFRTQGEDPRANHASNYKKLLELVPPTLPDAVNAAEDYKLAATAIVPWPGKKEQHPFEHFSDYWLNRPATRLDDPQLIAWLAANARTFQLISSGASKPDCNFKVDYRAGYNSKMPHLSEARKLSKMLVLKAVVAARSGDHGTAKKCLSTNLVLARHLESDPSVIAHVIALGLDFHFRLGILYMVNEVPIHDDNIYCMYGQLVDELPDTPKRLECFCRALLGDKYMGEMSLADAVQAPSTYGGGTVAFKTLDHSRLLIESVWYPAEVNFHTHVMDEYVQMVRSNRMEPVPEQEWMSKYRSAVVDLALNITPALNKDSAMASVRTEGNAKTLTLTALACARYRLKYGKDIEDLEQLAPEFLKTVPLDQRGHPIKNIHKYGQEGVLESIRLYSIGENEIDNKGEREKWKEDDIWLDVRSKVQK